MTKFGGWGTPGQGTLDITTEKSLLWGSLTDNSIALVQNAVVAGGTLDATNTPTNVLRAGLVLGQIAASGKYALYAAGNTDGTQIARAILWVEILSQDFTATNSDRVCPVLVGGPVKAGQLIGLDLLARRQLAPRFVFDDELLFSGLASPLFVTKTANYSVLAADHGTTFFANGSGSTTFTLPAIADGLAFKFVNLVGQNMVVTSNEGTNIVVKNNASASTLTYSTASNLIGAVVDVYSNPGATKWIAEQPCTNTLTVS